MIFFTKAFPQKKKIQDQLFDNNSLNPIAILENLKSGRGQPRLLFSPYPISLKLRKIEEF